MSVHHRPKRFAPRTALVVLVGTVVAMIVPILNGGPFFYFDTSAYVGITAKVVNVLFSAAPDAGGFTPAAGAAAHTGAPDLPASFGTPGADGVVFGGRSVYFGALAYAGWITDMWLPVLVQSAVLAWLTVTLFRHAAPGRWAVHAVLALLAVSCLSTASFFAGTIMPDIWAGLLVMALAVLWSVGARLSAAERWGLFAVLAFAVLAHKSHLALILAMIALFALFRLVRDPARRFPWGQIGVPLAAAAVGVAGLLAFSTAVRVAYDAEVVQRPFLTAHLVDLGPGTRFLQAECPDAGFALCDYADRLPVGWITFLFGDHPETGVFNIAPPAAQMAIAAEQGAFVRQVLAAEPLATLGGLAADGASQIWTLSIDDVALTHEKAPFIRASFPADLIALLEGTRVYARPGLLDALQRLTEITAALSAAALLGWLIQRAGRGASHGGAAPTDGDAEDVAGAIVAILVAGLLCNALICGILASPYGRFQARIVWLLPLAAVLVLARATAPRPTPTPPSAPPGDLSWRHR